MFDVDVGTLRNLPVRCQDLDSGDLSMVFHVDFMISLYIGCMSWRVCPSRAAAFAQHLCGAWLRGRKVNV